MVHFIRNDYHRFLDNCWLYPPASLYKVIFKTKWHRIFPHIMIAGLILGGGGDGQGGGGGAFWSPQKVICCGG